MESLLKSSRLLKQYVGLGMIKTRPPVCLVRIRREHLELLYRWRNEQTIWEWTRQNNLLHWDTHVRWFERQQVDPTLDMFLVCKEHDGDTDAIGVAGLTSIDRGNARAEFSLYIAPEFQMHGFGRPALATLFDHGFKNLNLNSIWGETIDGNPARHLFERIGMKHEGVRRDFYYKNGSFKDAHLYSILKSEWSV